MASHSVFGIHGVGSHAPLCPFWTLFLRPRIPLFITLGLRSWRFLCKTIFWVVIKTNFCCVPSGLSGGYLSWTEQYHSETPFCFGSYINHTYASSSEEECRSLRVRACKIRKVATSLLFWWNCAVHQVLKDWVTFSAFCLWDVIHRYMNTFFIGPVVAGQQVV